MIKSFILTRGPRREDHIPTCTSSLDGRRNQKNRRVQNCKVRKARNTEISQPHDCKTVTPFALTSMTIKPISERSKRKGYSRLIGQRILEATIKSLKLLTILDPSVSSVQVLQRSSTAYFCVCVCLFIIPYYRFLQLLPIQRQSVV